MEGFPIYKRYMDSGVEWFGKIPEHRSLEYIRAVTELKSERDQPRLPVLSVYREYGVILKPSRDDNHNATALDNKDLRRELGDFKQITEERFGIVFELQQRAHSPWIVAGLASESKKRQNTLRGEIPRSLLERSGNPVSAGLRGASNLR